MCVFNVYADLAIPFYYFFYFFDEQKMNRGKLLELTLFYLDVIIIILYSIELVLYCGIRILILLPSKF